MKTRPIIEIDEEKCDGCGQCVSACAEGAIQMVNGKAHLVSDSYCDGLGACLGECPRGAIRIIERPAETFDPQAVEQQQQKQRASIAPQCHGGGCPGTAMLNLRLNVVGPASQSSISSAASNTSAVPPLCHWPIQLHLVPPNAPFLTNTDIFLVADCVPFACRDFHERILNGNPVLVGCPKLDDSQSYVDKLAEILATNTPRTITIVHMEVPCCMGLMRIAHSAANLSGVAVPIREITVSRQGEILAG